MATPREELEALRRLQELEDKAAGGARKPAKAKALEPEFEPGTGFGARVMRNLGAAVGLGSEVEQIGLGVGRAIERGYRGAKQLGAETLATQAGLAAGGAQALGMDTLGGFLGRRVAAPLERVVARERRMEAEERGIPQTPLMRTGEIGANIASIVGPGALLRGTTAAPLFLPRTIAGSAAQGGVIGALQPTTSEEERAQNVTLGTAFGAGGAALPRAIGYGYGTLKSLIQPFTRSGQESIIASLLRRISVNPARLSAEAPSTVQAIDPMTGQPARVQRTLAEETLDPGIAQLQRQYPVQLADQISANNALRAQAIKQTFRGADQPSIEAIEGARDEAAEAALSRLPQIVNEPAPNIFGSVGGVAPSPALAVDLAPVEATLTRLAVGQRKRPAVAATINYVRDLLREPVRNADEAYQVRKTIGDLMEGKIGGDMASSRAARQQLLQAREVLDAQMVKAFPEWGQYLQNYRAASTAADQARVGQRLLEGAGAPRALDPASGEVMLTPAALLAGRNADRLTQAATGFRQAKATTTLTPEQQQLLTSLAEDADRIRFAQSAGAAIKSDTAQNLATQNVLRSALGGGRLAQAIAASQPGQRLATLGEKTYGLFGVPDRLQQVLTDVLVNPAEARRIMAALPAEDRVLVSQALGRIGGAGGALVPALTE